MDKQVAGGNFYDIIGGGLIAVKVNAVIQQHRELGIFRLIAENLPGPVVFGENGGDNLQFSCFVRIVFFMVFLLCTAGKNADRHHERK